MVARTCRGAVLVLGAMDDYNKGLLIFVNIPTAFFLLWCVAASIDTGDPGYFIIGIFFAAVLLLVELAAVFDIF